jgi:hypothetical protein
MAKEKESSFDKKTLINKKAVQKIAFFCAKMDIIEIPNPKVTINKELLIK